MEEARETPSVKVLDPADVPERKSYPPRMILILLGTTVILCVASAWILARARWLEVDPADPGKLLARDVMLSCERALKGVWRRRRRNTIQPSGPSDSH